MSTLPKVCTYCGKTFTQKKEHNWFVVPEYCERCDYHRFHTSMQIEIAVRFLEAPCKPLERPVHHLGSCYGGIYLTNELSRHVELGHAEYIRGNTKEEQIEYFSSKVPGYIADIKLVNERKIYEWKIGLPPTDYEYPDYKDGNCRGCHREVKINRRKYCHECVKRATLVTEDDRIAFFDNNPDCKLRGAELLDRIVEWKLINAGYDNT